MFNKVNEGSAKPIFYYESTKEVSKNQLELANCKNKSGKNRDYLISNEEKVHVYIVRDLFSFIGYYWNKFFSTKWQEEPLIKIKKSSLTSILIKKTAMQKAPKVAEEYSRILQFKLPLNEVKQRCEKLGITFTPLEEPSLDTVNIPRTILDVVKPFFKKIEDQPLRILYPYVINEDKGMYYDVSQNFRVIAAGALRKMGEPDKSFIAIHVLERTEEFPKTDKKIHSVVFIYPPKSDALNEWAEHSGYEPQFFDGVVFNSLGLTEQNKENMNEFKKLFDLAEGYQAKDLKGRIWQLDDPYLDAKSTSFRFFKAY
jgi:hypothetical protein